MASTWQIALQAVCQSSFAKEGVMKEEEGKQLLTQSLQVLGCQIGQIRWAEDDAHCPIAVLPDGRSYRRLVIGGGTVQTFNEMGFSITPTRTFLCIWGRGVIVVKPHPRSGRSPYQKEVLVWKEVGTSNTPQLAYIHEVSKFRPVNWLTGEEISSQE